MPQTYPADLEDVTRQLLSAYERAWATVVNEQERIAQGIVRNPRLWRQRDRLAEIRQRIEAEMGQVDALAAHWVSREYPRFYETGARAAAERLHSPFTWTQNHRDALTLLAKDTMDDLLEATSFVREDTKRFLRRVVSREVVNDQLLGKTAVQTAKNVTRFLQAQGITSVVYKNGARVGLDAYAEMAIRTKTAVGYNIGTLNQGAEFGVVVYEVFDGPSCGWSAHNDPDLANGKLVDAADAAAYVIAHPRCARSFGARPDLKAKDAGKATEGGQGRYRTEEARQARSQARAAAGLNGKPRTPDRVLERRLAQFQKITLPAPPTTPAPPDKPTRAPRRGRQPKWRTDLDKALADLDAQTIPTSSRVRNGEADILDLIRLDGGPSKVMLEREKALGRAGKAVDDEVTKRATAAVKRAGHRDNPAKLHAEWEKLGAQLKEANSAQFRYEVDQTMRLRRERADFRDASRQLQRAWLRMNDPEMARLMRVVEDLEERALAVGRERDAAEAAYAIAYRDAAREVLAEVRPMGGQLRYGTEKPTQITTPRDDGSIRPYWLDDAAVDEVKESLDAAADFYPQDWLDRANGHHELRVGRTDRGYQGDRGEGVVDVLLSYSDQGIVKAGDPRMMRVGLHELGHAMESADERIRALEWTFYQRRTSVLDRRGGFLKNQEKAIDMGGGMRGEMARPDKFRNVYMGKDYGNSPGTWYELLSMGMEGIFTGTNRVTWMDDDFRRFVMGLLASL